MSRKMLKSYSAFQRNILKDIISGKSLEALDEMYNEAKQLRAIKKILSEKVKSKKNERNSQHRRH